MKPSKPRIDWLIDWFLSFFLCYTCGMWTFQDQRFNPCHSHDPSNCTDNARFLTCCTISELLRVFFIKRVFFFFIVFWFWVFFPLQIEFLNMINLCSALICSTVIIKVLMFFFYHLCHIWITLRWSVFLSIMGCIFFCFIAYIFDWMPDVVSCTIWSFPTPYLLDSWHVEIPGPGIKPMLQQPPKPLQWQHWILNPLSHMELHMVIPLTPPYK